MQPTTREQALKRLNYIDGHLAGIRRMPSEAATQRHELGTLSPAWSSFALPITQPLPVSRFRK